MFFYCFSIWQLLHRCSKGTRRRKRGKMRARHHPRHLPGGRISRRERKGDRADSHKKNQVKCASNEMRFDSGINLFFHVGSLVKRSSSHFGCRLPIVYKKPSRNVNTMFCKFLDFSGGFALRRSCTGTIRRVTWTALRAPASAPKRAAGAKRIRRPESRFQHWYFWIPPILG